MVLVRYQLFENKVWLLLIVKYFELTNNIEKGGFTMGSLLCPKLTQMGKVRMVPSTKH